MPKISSTFVHALPTIITKRRRSHGAPKDGGGKTMKKRGVFAVVSCPIHGKPNGSLNNHLELRCAVPRNKREKFGGCPLCAKARRNNFRT